MSCLTDHGTARSTYMDGQVSFLAELDGLFRWEGDAVQSCIQRQKVGSFPVASQGAFAAEENRCMRKPLAGFSEQSPH